MRRHHQDGGVFGGRWHTSSVDPVEAKTKEKETVDHDPKVVGHKSAHHKDIESIKLCHSEREM